MTPDLIRYKNLHVWMVIPFVLMQTGFIDSYWMTWASEQWMRHIHALSAMCWYVLLMTQPYLIMRGRTSQHRTWGLIGFFIAGATAFTALSLVSQNINFGDQGGFGPPFTADFFYGLVLVETLMMIAFVVAVLMAILKRRNMEDHSMWLISTVFYILMPGLGRGMVFPVFALFGPNNWLAVSITATLIISALVIIGIRLKKIMHPAILLGIAVNIPTFFVYWLGQQTWYIEWIKAFMKYE